MRGFFSTLKRYIFAENPLLVSVLGLSGAVVFTRNIKSALTATVSETVVLTVAMAVMFIFERIFGGHDEHPRGITGAKIVFFSTAVAVTSVCGMLTARFLPSVWGEIGAPWPLLAVGSLALVSSEHGGETFGHRTGEALAHVIGYGAAVIAVALIRQAAGGVPFFAGTGGALILIGAMAAVLRASCGAAGARMIREQYGAPSDEGADGDADVDITIMIGAVEDALADAAEDTVTDEYTDGAEPSDTHPKLPVEADEADTSVPFADGECGEDDFLNELFDDEDIGDAEDSFDNDDVDEGGGGV